MPEPIVRIVVCTNDDQGDDTGRVSAIHFYEDDEYCEALMELEHNYHGSEPGCSQLPQLTHDEGARLLHIAGRPYEPWSNSRATHVGNIFWDAFRLEESVARQLATDLMRSGDWHDIVSTEGWFWSEKEGGLV